MPTVKDSVLEIVRRLPDECTWAEVLRQIYIRQKVEAGLDDADRGRTVLHSEVFNEFEE